MYFKELTDEMTVNPMAKVLQSAIRLSLDALAADWESRELKKYSASDLYTSLCVLENQQFAPVPVLSRMWDVSEAKAETICTIFRSMSLTKISIQMLDGREQCGLLIHDLYLEYYHQKASHGGDERLWHRRSLDGHMTGSPSWTGSDSEDHLDCRLSLNMLECKSRPWWRDDTANKEYILQHLSRHLRGAGLDVELGATVLDIRWISAQGLQGGAVGLKTDFDILQTVIEAFNTPARTLDPISPAMVAPVKTISKIIVARADRLHLGIRVLSHIFFADLLLFSKTNELIHRFLERMKDIVPKPFLEGIVSFYRTPGDDLKFEFEHKAPRQAEVCYSRAVCTSRGFLRRWRCIRVQNFWTMLFDSVRQLSRRNIRIRQMQSLRSL